MPRTRRSVAGPVQVGGLSLKQVGSFLGKANKWAKDNKIISKAAALADKIVPEQYKSNQVYQGIKKVTDAAAQAGYGVVVIHPKRKTRRARK